MKSGIKYIMKCLENMKVKDKYEKDKGVYFKGPCENQTEHYAKNGSMYLVFTLWTTKQILNKS